LNCGAPLPLSARAHRHWNGFWFVLWRFCKESCRDAYVARFAEERQRKRAVQLLFHPQ
jgi:hypothetical protein